MNRQRTIRVSRQFFEELEGLLQPEERCADLKDGRADNTLMLMTAAGKVLVFKVRGWLSWF